MQRFFKTNLRPILFLGGLSLFFATVEMMIPKPMPFLKLGVAMLPLLLFAAHLGFFEILLLALLKVISQGLISGSLLSYIGLFSLCATLGSALVMWGAAHFFPKGFSLLGLSLLGAAASNTIQLLLALGYFFPGMGSLLIPWNLSFGLLSGLLLGLFALRFSSISGWYRDFVGGLAGKLPPAASADWAEPGGVPKSDKNQKLVLAKGLRKRILSRFVLSIFGLAVAFILRRSLWAVPNLFLFIALNVSIGYRPWWRSIFLLGTLLVLFHLLFPTGKVLWILNPADFLGWPAWDWELRLTEGALLRGLRQWIFLISLIQISRFGISVELRVPGFWGDCVQKVFGVYEALLSTPVPFRLLAPAQSLEQLLNSARLRNIAFREDPPRETTREDPPDSYWRIFRRELSGGPKTLIFLLFFGSWELGTVWIFLNYSV